MLAIAVSIALLLALHVEIGRAECWRNTTCDGPETTSFPGPWQANIIAPESRTLSPVRVLDENHTLVDSYPPYSPPQIEGNSTMLIFDWGLEVGGVVTIKYGATGSGTLGIAFSESSNFTGYISDESNGGAGNDGALYSNIHSEDGEKNVYVVPDDRARGGFRYLSLYVLTNSTLNISVEAITVELSFHPNWKNMQAYGGYFYSSDDLLNRIWYSGAYTLQTNIMPTNTARVYPCLDTGWENNADLDTDGPGLGAGNKRDRAVWAGDFGMAIRSAAISLGDMGTLRRSLKLQYDVQQTTGELPWVPPPINIFGSDTYHMATLLATRDYILFSGDMDFLSANWAKYKLGMSFVTSKIDSTGMMNVTGSNNWGRTAISSGYTTDGNMLLYGCLMSGAVMASWMNDTIGETWTGLAKTIESAIIEHNWDSNTGAFWNSAADHSNHCEDGNSMSLYYGGVNSTIASGISDFLSTAWTPIGAEAGELPGSIVMFVEGFEVKGHLAARETSRGLDLIRLSWGWNLDNPYGTESTFVEGYKTDGSWRYRDDMYSKNGSYTAHSLGWSTGPVDALVSYVVGLQPTGPGGSTWVLEPQIGDLTSAEGGFTLPTGKFSSGWILSDSALSIWVDVPSNTTGTLALPISNTTHGPPGVELNGRPITATGHVANNMLTLKLGGGLSRVQVQYESQSLSAR